MKLVQNQYFVDVHERLTRGMRPGEPADLRRAGSRWICEECRITTTTRWYDKEGAFHGRAHPFLPRTGKHRTHIKLRHVLMLRRNASECLNSRLKGKGIGNGGMNTPRWVSTDDKLRWLVYTTVLGLTLQRLAHVSGQYQAPHEEADRCGLLDPVEPEDVPLAPSTTGT